jgi:hypothetical protein
MLDPAADFAPGEDPEKVAYRAAFQRMHPYSNAYAYHLRDGLSLAIGLTELIADDADIRATHGETLCPESTEAAARAVSLILRIASIQAEALARQVDQAGNGKGDTPGAAQP